MHFSSMTFPSLSSNSCAHKRTNFSMRIHKHIHKHTDTFTHIHMHTHVRTLKDMWWEVCRLPFACFVFIDFFLCCAFAAVWFANAAKIAMKCSFYQFHSLYLSCTLSPYSLSLCEETVNSHTRRWRRLRCLGLCRLLIKLAIFLLLLLLTRRTLCYQHSPPPLLLLSRFAFYTFSPPTRRCKCCCCRRRRSLLCCR